MTPEPLWRARVRVRREALDDLVEVLAVMDPAPTSWEDMDSGEAWVETCDPDRAEVARRAREMADLVSAYDGRVHAAEIERLEPEEWTEAWKRFFHTARVSEHIVVHPVWEPFEPEPGDIVVDIDPGMSFGTGLHPTTRTCLRFLDELAAEPGGLGPVLDLGCGSGILSIAAAKLGAPRVDALDFDPAAVGVTAENLAANRVPAGVVRTAVGDVLRDALPSAPVVVANILASVLIDASGRIAASVAPGGTLLLSGILDAQFGEVVEAFQAHGFSCVRSVLDAEWRSGVFRRQTPSTAS